jgi:hypothetical protein
MGEGKPDVATEFPDVDARQKGMLERSTVQKVLIDQVNALKSISVGNVVAQ